MDILTATSVTLVIGSISYGVYLFNKSDQASLTKHADMDFFFSKGNRSPRKKLIQVIDDTKETLDVAIYSITQKDIVTHLCKATKRGVQVRVITDRKQSKKLSNQTASIHKLIESGVPVKVNNHKGLMHLKLMISDNETTTSGSYNFTYPAESKNNEMIIVIKDKKIAKHWTKEFNNMWDDSAQFSPYPYPIKEKYA